MKILIVDDDENSRVYLERALKSQGYNIEGAENGALALEKALNSPPDIIISDIMMPVMDGFELCRKFKADKRLQNIPFIFYSSIFADKKDCELATYLGASRFIVKPIEMLDFFGIIKEVIEELKEKKPIEPEVTVENDIIDEMYSQAIKRKLEQKIQELEESRHSYKTLAENLPGIVYRIFIRENNRIQFFNKAAQSVTGYAEKELRPGEVCSIDAIILPEDRSKVVNVVNSSIFENIPFVLEYRIRHKDGSIRYMLEQGTPIYGSDKKPLYIEGVIFDITERKLAEEALRQAMDEAQRANNVKTNFLLMMSHELRTPMNAILGFSEMLKQKTTGELNEKQAHFIGNIILGGNKLNNILTQILDIIKMDIGKLELCIETIPVPETIDDVTSVIKEKAAAKNVVVVKKVDPQLEHIESDKQKLKQVLINLLDNAVKFSKPEGGTVTISSIKEGDMAKFSVSDTGIGIKKEDIEKLFQRFSQLDSGTTRAHGGIGIGLAISKEFVDMMGGKLSVKSEFGKGSIFTLTLPLKGGNEL